MAGYIRQADGRIHAMTDTGESESAIFSLPVLHGVGVSEIAEAANAPPLTR